MITVIQQKKEQEKRKQEKEKEILNNIT